MARFDGKVAIVTGGRRGIGGATVARLVSEGAKVMIADLEPPATLAEGTAFQRTDATSTQDVAALIEATLARWGKLDILVNNAGMGAMAETADMDEDLWDQVFAINTRAIFVLCKAAIPAMRQNGGGAIVNIASISGLGGDYAMAAYNASKGAVVNYTRALAMDSARDGIRVNAVCPGLIETDMASPGIADPVDRDHWLERIPLGRPGKPEEMAALITFLASDDASYMTGSIVAADGGVTAHTGQPNMPVRVRLRQERRHNQQAV